MIYTVTIAEKTYRVDLQRSVSGWTCRLDGRDFSVDVAFLGHGMLSLLIDGKSFEVRQEKTAEQTSIIVGQTRFSATVVDPRSLRARGARDGGSAGPRKITAPMPGKVVRVLVALGSEVEAGQPVIVIEAMKMQNELKAPRKGKLSKINVTEGAAVEAGQALAEVE